MSNLTDTSLVYVELKSGEKLLCANMDNFEKVHNFCLENKGYRYTVSNDIDRAVNRFNELIERGC